MLASLRLGKPLPFRPTSDHSLFSLFAIPAPNPCANAIRSSSFLDRDSAQLNLKLDTNTRIESDAAPNMSLTLTTKANGPLREQPLGLRQPLQRGLRAST